MLLGSLLCLSCGRKQGSGVFDIEVEQEFHAVGLAVERLGPIAQINGSVQFLMGLDEFRRHCQRIIEDG